MLRDPSLIPLSQQHHNGLAMCVLTRRALAEDSGPESVARAARRAIDRYELELANHFEIEEQVLFPECGSMAIIAELLADHRAIEAMVGELRTAPTAALLEQLCALLTKHIRREENELFEQIQAALPREVLDHAGAEIERRAVRICL